MSRIRRNFSNSFKAKVVLEALKKRSSLEDLAKKFELQPTQISKWKAEALGKFGDLFQAGSSKNAPLIDAEKLYATIGEQKVEIEFLKKVAMKPMIKRREMIDKESVLSKESQCYLLTIHRSGLYFKPKGADAKNLEIMKILGEQYFKTPFYGVKRLKVLLQQKGISVNIKRVRRLMRIMNWKTIFPETKTTIMNRFHYKYPYFLRGLAIKRKHQVWAMDITYVPM